MQRIAYLDNIKALCVLLVLFLHVCLPYSRAGFTLNYYYPNPFEIPMSCLVFCLDNVSMPLFFLLAGYFAQMSLCKQAFAPFMRSRLLRLGLPLLAGLLLITPWHLMIYFQAVLLNQIKELNYSVIYHVFLNLDYLWFIYFLLLYCSIAAVLITFKKINPPLLRSSWFLSYPQFCFAIPLTFFIALGSKSYIQLSSHLLPMPQAFLSYGLFFLLGFSFSANDDRWHQLTTPLWWYFIPGFLSLFFAFHLSLNADSNQIHFLLGCFCSAYAALSLTLGILLFFYQFVNKPFFISRKICEISYWVYLTQIPILLIGHYILAYYAPPVLEQVIISFSITLIVCGLSYQCVVKPTFLNRFISKGSHQ